VGVKPGYVEEVVVEMVTEDEDEVDGVVVILTVMGFKVFSNNGQPTPSVWQLTRM